jgi:hypothetical protein
MGHIRLSRLPKTQRWKEVIAMLEEGITIPELASATFHAAQTGLSRVPEDTGFTQTLTTIFQFIDAIQSKSPITNLRRLGFDISESSSLFEFIAAFKKQAAGASAQARARSDIGEIARNSFAEVLIATANATTQSLFGELVDDGGRLLRAQLKGSSLGITMHEFFVAFTQRYLNYYLGRETPYHVGAGKAFANIDNHSEFTKAFDLHIRQTVRITDEFTPGWYGKARYEKRLSHADVTRFAHVAFKKISSEFERGAESGG